MLYNLYKKIVANKGTFEDFRNFMLLLSTHDGKEDFILDIYRKKIKEEKKRDP